MPILVPPDCIPIAAVNPGAFPVRLDPSPQYSAFEPVTTPTVVIPVTIKLLNVPTPVIFRFLPETSSYTTSPVTFKLPPI